MSNQPAAVYSSARIAITRARIDSSMRLTSGWHRMGCPEAPLTASRPCTRSRA